jgi:hypothetical protein
MDVKEEIKAKIDNIPVYRSEVTDTVRLIGADIKKLKEENKQLKKSLTDAKCRVILLEENYITLLEDLTYSAKIDLFIYITFAICIAILGFFVYGLTH